MVSFILVLLRPVFSFFLYFSRGPFSLVRKIEIVPLLSSFIASGNR